MNVVRNTVYLRVITPVFAAMPAWLAYGLALLYADARIRLDKFRRQEAVLCIRHVLGPQLKAGNEETIARDYFRNRACIRVDAMRLSGDGRRLTQLVAVRGLESIQESLAQGRGVVVCGAHYGSARACAAVMGVFGLPVTMIARWAFMPDRLHPWKPQKFYQFAWKPIEHHLWRRNIEARPNSLTDALEAASILRQNEVVYTLLDSETYGKARARAVELNFLNGRISILPGAATLARLVGSSVHVAVLRRSSNWRSLLLEVYPNVPFSDKDSVVLQTCISILEREIRRDPSQWELWKMRTLVRLGLYPEDQAMAYYRDKNRKWDKL